MGGMELGRRVLERRHYPAFAATLDERILSVSDLAPEVYRFVAGLRESNKLGTAESEIGSLVGIRGDSSAPDPSLRAGRIDEQVQAVAISVTAGRFEGPYSHRSQTLIGMAASWFSSTER